MSAKDPIARRRHWAWPVGATFCLALLPKCPLCVGVLLAGLGMSASGAAITAPLVRPLLLAWAGLGLLALAVSIWRARTKAARSAPARCCRGA